MITIGQIASLAGVSKATVSRVINNNGYVREQTREKIEGIIKEHHYSPSATAQNLSRKETTAIGVVVPDLDNTFFTEVLAGAAEIVDENGLTMLVCNTSEREDKEKAVLKMMEQQRVRGVIFTPADGYSDEVAAKTIRHQLKHLKVPVVLVDRDIENVQWDGVFYENFESGYLATKRLITRGYKRIGIITGDMKKLKHARERFLGYVKALEENQLLLEAKYVYEGDYSLEKAYRLTVDMIHSGDYPEAMVLSNNTTTLGFVKGITECGKTLNDIAIVGIDHIPIFDMIGYQYECITRDTKGMGRKAMELLLKRLDNPEKTREVCMVPCIERFQK